jgi:hypothetical protein
MDLTPQRQMQQQEDDLRRLHEEVRLQEARLQGSQPASPRDDADGARWARGATLPMDLAAAAASRATGLIAAAGAPDADYHKRRLAMAAGSHAQHARAAGEAAESSGAGSLEQVTLVSLLGDVRSLLLQVMNSSSASVGGGLGVGGLGVGGSANGAGGSIARQHLLRPAQAVIQLAGGSGPRKHRTAQQIHLGDHSGTAWHRMRDHDDALGHRRERWRERWRPWFACFGV